MARAKKTETPKVDIGAEIFSSLRDLEKLKGIPVEYMVERLKQALTNAYRKDREDDRDIPAENVVVDLSEKGLFMHTVKTVVEEVEEPSIQMHIDAAKKIDPHLFSITYEITFSIFNLLNSNRKECNKCTPFL